jgi:hypothetical protein
MANPPYGSNGSRGSFRPIFIAPELRPLLEDSMPKCLFIVRATVADPAKRAAFDAWYRNEHLPDAAKSFGAEKAWRGWSETDPAVHAAYYRFADRAALDRGTAPDVIKRLVADFDQAWSGVPRSREIMTIAEEI